MKNKEETQLDRFLNLLKAKDVYYTTLKDQIRDPSYKFKDKSNSYVIAIRYSTGGIAGGSCWDDSENYTFRSDPPDKEELNYIENALIKIAPNISFFNYFQIKQLENEDFETENEYYGNSTDYRIQFVFVEDLMNKLIEFGLFE